MTPEQKSKENKYRDRDCQRRQLILGMIFGSIIALVLANHFSNRRDLQLQSVLETYFFGEGLAELTGDTSVLENVLTEGYLQHFLDSCKRGRCNGDDPPEVIGAYRIVKSTEEFAVVEQEHRPIITDLERKPESYDRTCFSLERDGANWRITGRYIDCDRFLPNKYK